MAKVIIKSGGGFLFVILVVGLTIFPISHAKALNRWVTVVNNTSTVMVHFYASNRDRRSWEEDILRRSVVYPGRKMNVNIDDGTGYCIYDLKAVFSDGGEAVRWGVNVCEVGLWTVVD